MKFIPVFFSRLILSFFLALGDVAQLAFETFGSIFRGRIRGKLLLQQIAEVGYRSQLVVIVTGAFTGAVFTAQAYFQFASLNMQTAVGPVVTLAMFRELGPVLTGLMVAGRVGAAMSAEIGTMKVTQQIDALRALAVHPVDYLVVPRALAMFISMPLLVVECVGCGVLAAYWVAVKVLNVESVYFVNNLKKFTDSSDIAMSLIKGAVFGVIIVFISCREGLRAKDGAVGVGRATTETVVTCSLAVLIVNFFMTMFLNIIFPAGQR
ncbi:phospholipid/cholesterol/gamma-HCH transport system permease protein [Terrimicrobium sacchariphilum]|uniref:Phospholipid/cholesterol/gamma-HCH transport system permease protein n=1 Tax=Terrimicrobium sacchariphilum TaxID=690879 RepID=A0A146G7L6_TERSA|nr:ABC transporter permease [Terrimicrobium sacchariphilum]GAT33705.1 phospholipid/cholesterol/gamma-HCH transport system permease protein [Terrimicrobium sacchariphilum]